MANYPHPIEIALGARLAESFGAQVLMGILREFADGTTLYGGVPWKIPIQGGYSVYLQFGIGRRGVLATVSVGEPPQVGQNVACPSYFVSTYSLGADLRPEIPGANIHSLWYARRKEGRWGRLRF